jgi:hypothetical protein
MTKEIIKSIKTISPKGKFEVNIDVWKEDKLSIVGHLEISDIESGGQKTYVTSNLIFNNDYSLNEYDGQLGYSGLPPYVFTILNENGFNSDEVRLLQEED